MTDKPSPAKQDNNISETKTLSPVCRNVLTVGRVLVLHLLDAANLERVLEAVAHLGASLVEHYAEDILAEEDSVHDCDLDSEDEPDIPDGF